MSFGTALSGINAATSDLNVISNNIANNNTTGFKLSRAEFADLTAQVVAGNLGAGNLAIGTGVQLADVTQLFTQGSLSFTGNPLDLAINGQGFFRLNDNGAAVYTRSGVFGVDRDGYVINRAGQHLTGFLADASGTVTNTLGDVQLTTTDFPPFTTSEVNLGLNLDAGASPPAVAGPIDPSDSSTYNNSTSVTVYDSQGTAHTLTILFAKAAAPNTWNIATSVDGTAIGNVTLVPSSTLQFTSSGVIDTAASPQPITATIDLDAVLGPGNGATRYMPVELDFSATTQFGSPFAINELNQNGFSSGRLTGVEIDETGVLFARYTNGQSQAVGQVTLTNFKNASGLQQAGASAWAESFASGPPLTGKPGTGTFGLLQSGALETSNVELTDQLVNMIRAQRNFQANAQVLSTNDQLTQTIINLR